MATKRPRCAEDPAIVGLADDLRLISDPNRLRIICLLLGCERCVCEVERELGISQQLASHHLNVLKDGGFLASRREGTSAYYSVDRDRLGRVLGVLNDFLGKGMAGARGNEPCCATTGGAATRRSVR